MSELEEIVGEFLVESYENLDRYDEDLLTLEKDPANAEVLDGIFRTIHTIKGTCGFFGFARLESVSHKAENLLGKLRDGELVVSSEIASALLATGDTLRDMLHDIEATGSDDGAEHADLVATLERLQSPASPTSDGDGSTHRELDGRPPSEAGEETTPKLGELLIEQGLATQEDVALALRAQELGDERPLGEILMSRNHISIDEVDQTLARQATARGLADSSIRVDVGLLDKLMNLVGDLVLTRNQIVHLAAEQRTGPLAAASERLDAITTELQAGVTQTRMQPIGNVWNKLSRLVRDLTVSCGKEAELVMEGQDTELDKTIIEAIKDPLTHLVRNAVDHGIETTAQRLAAGKPAAGRLVLRAYHEAGQVSIEIADDGAGIDVRRLAEKAVETGLVSAAQAAMLSEHEALQLIFAAGFTTAASVTNVSGRGVGMDVVRTNIERIGGTVEVHSLLGDGTTIRLRIPLTLAIVPVLIVGRAGDWYAVPQLNLVEVARLADAAGIAGIELVHGAPAYSLHGRLLPLVDLAPEAAPDARPPAHIVVLQGGGRHFGLGVDEVADHREIVVKPLGDDLPDATLFAGATVMGDGTTALVIDALSMAEHALGVLPARS